MRLKKTLFLLISLHAAWLVIVTLLWLNLPYTYDNESTVISFFSILKNVVLHKEDKPAREDFLLINVAYEKALVPKYDDYGFEQGNEVITDRRSLASFFGKAHANHHQYIFCDVFFEKASPDDSLLLNAITKTDRIVFPSHYEDSKAVLPVINIPTALSDYQSDYESFTKYSFVQHDTVETVALKMHKELNGAKYSRGTLFSLHNGTPALNSFIIDFPIRQYDIFREDTLGYSSMHLRDFNSLPDSLASLLLKDKIVVIGDFLENDMHETIYGTTAGPLIHLNAYLNLAENRNNLSVTFIIFLFVIYLCFSWVLLVPGHILTMPWIRKLQDGKMGILFDFLKYAFFLTLTSIVSYLWFGIHLNILILTLYISLLENVIEYAHKRIERKKVQLHEA